MTFNVTFSQPIVCSKSFNKSMNNVYRGLIMCTKNPIGLILFNEYPIVMNEVPFHCSTFEVKFETKENWFIMHIKFTPPKDQLFMFNYFVQNKHWHESNYQGVFPMLQTG